MPIPDVQTSISTATTAVASQHPTYPSAGNLHGFNMPNQLTFVKTDCDGVSVLSDESEGKLQEADNKHGDEAEGKHHLRPLTPSPPSPVSTESSDRKLSDDTTSTVHGESMMSPKPTLSSRADSTKTLGTPRWPFHDATPRPSVMASIARSLTDSSSRLNQSIASSPPGQVSVTDSLDEFQLNHPNARRLELHPLPFVYGDNTASVSSVPQLVPVITPLPQPLQALPAVHKSLTGRVFHSRRQSRRLPKLSLRQRHEKRASGVKPKVWWFESISTHKDMFYGSCVVAIFFIVDAFISVTAYITLTVNDIPIPSAVLVWVVVGITTCAFAASILYLMVRFRRDVAFDEESRGRSSQRKLCNETETSASYEMAMLRRMSAVHDGQSGRDIPTPDFIEMTSVGPVSHIDGAMSAHHNNSNAHLRDGAIARQDNSDQVDNYWTDVSLAPSSQDERGPSTAAANAASKPQAPVPTSNGNPTSSH
ncbi:hypothetical protein CTRI78_v011033 [Colletotrichum trifolii]|uniref:Transmembrane protein n=1 Tax=Colletotrichum trifolii TaxID=5466 RepID=A0A4R8QKW3_COLTR|nr:hypothetical protein CTRI78_v011033 [Colletotrichum trifolii]